MYFLFMCSVCLFVVVVVVVVVLLLLLLLLLFLVVLQLEIVNNRHMQAFNIAIIITNFNIK